MIDQESQKQNDETADNNLSSQKERDLSKEKDTSKERDDSKQMKQESLSFKIYTDFISQSGMFMQIVLCWYLIQLHISGSVPLSKFGGEGIELLKNIQIEIHTLLWSMNILGFLIVLFCVRDYSKKMFFLHFFPFIAPLFFIIISFYFHLVVLRKVKLLFINPLSYVILGGLTISGLEMFRSKIDSMLFLLGIVAFTISNILSWFLELCCFNSKNLQQQSDQNSSFAFNCQSILVEVILFVLQTCVLFAVINAFQFIDYQVELLPAFVICSSQLLNYILLRFSLSKLKNELDKQEIPLISQNHKQTSSHYVFIFYINIIFLISILFFACYYLPSLLHPIDNHKIPNPQPQPQPLPNPRPNATHPEPPTNKTNPVPIPKNTTYPLPQPLPYPKNQTHHPFPKNITVLLPKNGNFSLPHPKNGTVPQAKNETISFSLVKNKTKVHPKNMNQAEYYDDNNQITKLQQKIIENQDKIKNKNDHTLQNNNNQIDLIMNNQINQNIELDDIDNDKKDLVPQFIQNNFKEKYHEFYNKVSNNNISFKKQESTNHSLKKSTSEKT